MSTKPNTFDPESRPPHIRYFEYLQIALIGIVLAPQFVVAREQLLFRLVSLGPMIAVVLGLTLAVSRGRQNWARWALLVIFFYVVSSAVPFLFIVPGVSLAERIVAIVLTVVLLGGVLSLAFTKQSSAWIHAKNAEKALGNSHGTAAQQQPAGPARRAYPATFRLSDRPGMVWALTSGGGAAVGAGLACLAFPSARFAQNLVGHFSWALVGFASTVGLGFGLAQSAMLAHFLRSSVREQRGRIRLVTLAWIIATAVSVFAMIFPLWWTLAEELVLAPGYLVAVMTPGIALLAVLQWALIRSCAPLRGWLWRTAVGGAIGAPVGLFAAVGTAAIGAVLPLPMEAVWAGSIGLVIGAMQAKLIRELKWGIETPPKQVLAHHGAMFRAQPISIPIQQP